MRPSYGLTILFLSALSLLVECKPSEESPSYQFFVLDKSGSLKTVDKLPAPATQELKPWPFQMRITDMCEYQGQIVIAINGQGIMTLEKGSGNILARQAYDQALFQGRTTTSLFKIDQKLYCHLYQDTSFGSKSMPETNYPLVLVQINGDQIGLEPLLTKLWPSLSGRQAVLAKRLNYEELAIQWKENIAEGTVFYYSLFNLKDGFEEEMTDAWFNNNFPLKNLLREEAKDELAFFLKGAVSFWQRQRSNKTGIKQILFVQVEDLTSFEEKNYIVQEQDVSSSYLYDVLYVVNSSYGQLALFKDGSVLSGEGRPKVPSWHFPPLPEGYCYTGIVESESLICASWEEVDFYRVGQAGLVVSYK